MSTTTDDSHLIEHFVRREALLEGGFFDVWRDHVRMPDGGSATRDYVVHPGAVMIVPILDDGQLVMERQFRHPVGRILLEFPAGKIDPGEAAFTTAVRELAEETGYRAAEWAYAGLMHNACAYSTEGIEIYFARGLSLGDRDLDDSEFLDVLSVTEADLEAGIGRGDVTDAKTMIGLLWLQKWRAGRWPLSWQKAP